MLSPTCCACACQCTSCHCCHCPHWSSRCCCRHILLRSHFVRDLLYQEMYSLHVKYGLRNSVPAARRCSPMPLCDSLSCVHLDNEKFHRGLMPWRGPFGSPDLAGWASILVFLYRTVSLTEDFCVSCHCHTLLPFTCVHDLLRNVVHCGRLRLRVLFLTRLSCVANKSYQRF